MPEDGGGVAKESERQSVREDDKNQAGGDTSRDVDEVRAEQKVEPPEVDDFGLPIRPARRRAYEEEEGSADGTGEAIVKEDTKDKVNPDDSRADKIGAEDKPAKPDSVPQETGTSTQSTSKEKDVTKPDQPQDDKDQPPTSPTSPRKSNEKPRGHAPKKSLGASEWSHQIMAPQAEEEEEKKEELEWQEMPALATYRQYDDWGKVTAKAYDEADDESMALGGAAKGYTRVQDDDDAHSTTSMDDNTAYLFKEGYARNALDEEDEARDLISQMQTTKELLTEGQRIAYVGVVRLSMVQMVTDLEALPRTRGSMKVVNLATEATKMWSQKMMVRLYSHMEISSQEQVMVEQLAEHGLKPADLTPALMQNARVKNPEAKPESNPQSEAASASSSTRPSMNSPRPSGTVEKRKSTTNLNSLETPVVHEDEVLSGTETPPPAYEERTADNLHFEDSEKLADNKNIDLDLRWTVLCDLFLLLIADATYDARSRVLLERVGDALSVPWQEICRFEKRVTDALEMQEQADKETWNEDDHLEARKKAMRKKRLMVMGLCTVGGGLVIGLSAGFLAPVIGAGLAAGFTSIGVAGTGTFLAGTGAAALIGTTGALTGGTVAVRASDRRTGAVKTFEYRPLHNNKRVNLTVTVAGWMTGNVDDVRLPFSTVDPVMGDVYSVHWEPEMLKSTGATMAILGTEALTQTVQQVLGATFLATLMAGLSLPLILTKLSYLIDNPWTVSIARADAAGLILADSIIDRNLGVRPITLVGFSLGARVIFSALKELARRGGLGLVQNVYLFGSPMVFKQDEWLKARSVVSGRFVNAYATNDWILGYLFRATGGGIMRVAGLSEVQIPTIENFNVTADVPGHMAYRAKMPILLRKVGWEVESDEFAEIEDPDPDNHERRQRELINEIEEARRQLDEKPEKKGFLARFSRKKAAQKKSWETYDDTSTRIDPSKDPEKIVNENSNVMFDVEAIRKEALELAKKNPSDIEEIKAHMQVREIQSTLPPMKITSPGTSPALPKGAAAAGRSNSSSHDLPRGHLRQTQSYSGSGTWENPGTNSNSGYNSPRYGTPKPHDNINEDSQVTMSFEDSPRKPLHDSNGVINNAWSSSNGSTDRPSLGRSAATTPSYGAAAAAGVGAGVAAGTGAAVGVAASGSNPWADEDEDFGREKEVEMSFE
ncbi:hypothetical protein Q7P37_011446 [Cladosporium fusiforme]